MADNQEVALGKWEKFENELDNNDANQGQEFNQFIESRKNSTDNTSIFTSSGNQDRYKEFSRLDQESGYKGWSIDIRGKRRICSFLILKCNFLILKSSLINFKDHFLYYITPPIYLHMIFAILQFEISSLMN